MPVTLGVGERAVDVEDQGFQHPAPPYMRWRRRLARLQVGRPLRMRFTMASRMIAPTKDTARLPNERSELLIVPRPNSHPPSMAPMMPTTTLSSIPCCAFVFITML